MADNGRGIRPHLAGGRDLGPQQVALTDVRFVAAINLSVVDRIGDVPFDVPCLQVIDLSNGRAMVTPVNAPWMRRLADQLQRAADGLESLEGVGSPGSHSTVGG